MADMTVAEKVCATLSALDGLEAIWPGLSVVIGIHGGSHEDVHTVSGNATAAYSSGRWHLGIGFANWGTNPKLFANADETCAACVKLIDQSKAREERRHVAAE